MSKISAAARAKAWSPEARAKATATREKNKREKERLLANAAGVMAGTAEMSLDAIPDREPKKYNKKPRDLSKVKYNQGGHWISDADYMILKMAKMMLKEGK